MGAFDIAIIVSIIITVTIVLIILAAVMIGRRQKFLCSIPSRELYSFKHEAINKLRNQGYLLKEKQDDKVFVQKNNFSATTLVFKQNGSNVDVMFIHSNSTVMLVAIVVCIFTIWILGIVLAIIADSNSKDFRNNELIPLLRGHATGNIRCPNCGRLMPQDANICPYCGKQMK